jgi:hypothetical protein
MTERQTIRKTTAQARTVAAPLQHSNSSEFGMARPTARELSRASNIAPSRRDEEGGDSVLSRYFKEMAGHQVMGADEELKAAERVENAEADIWCKLLGYIPAAERLLDQLEPDLMAMPEEERPNMATVEVYACCCRSRRWLDR